MNINKKAKILINMIINPLFLLVYFITWYNLYKLCMYGKSNVNIMILSLCIIFLVVWFIIYLYKVLKDKNEVEILVKEKEQKYELENKILKYDVHMINEKTKKESILKSVWSYLAIFILVGTTLFYGAEIYSSAVKYNGKLSWFLEELFNKKTVDFTHNNIYDDGVEGILSDIREKIDMPEDLYMSKNFVVNFKEDGTITSFDTFLYGNDEKKQLKSFLISYDYEKSNNITIYLNGDVNDDYSKDKSLDPFIETMKVVNLKNDVNKWPGEDKYEVSYSGKRNFEYSQEGIEYIDSNGNMKNDKYVSSNMTGYIVSLYIPGKESEYCPIRYNMVRDLENISEGLNVNYQSDEGLEKYFLSDDEGYELLITGSSLGSRSYSLYGTYNGGETWNIINEDPFNGDMGTADGMTFINEKLGFLSLSKSGGEYGVLYKTQDGGNSYTKVEIPTRNISLINGKCYNPFVFPKIPYEENGVLYLTVGQGSMGDYNNGVVGLYESKDYGETWEFVREMNEER